MQSSINSSVLDGSTISINPNSARICFRLLSSRDELTACNQVKSRTQVKIGENLSPLSLGGSSQVPPSGPGGRDPAPSGENKLL